MSDGHDTAIRDRLLRAAVTCVQRLAVGRGNALPLLRQVAALRWRIDPASRLFTPAEVEEHLGLPIEEWLDPSVRGDYTGPLQVAGFPSTTCLEIALEVDELAYIEDVQGMIKRVRDLCRLQDGGEETYRRFRLYVIEHPLVDSTSGIQELLVPLGIGVRDMYMSIPEHLKRNGEIYPCPVCGWPMTITAPAVACQSSWCVNKIGAWSWVSARLVNNGSAKELVGHAPGDALMLRPPIWKFTLIPGLLELSLARRIEALGLPADLWPGVDASDIETVVNGTVVTIDAKAWRSATRLATHLKTLDAARPTWIVVPDYMEKHVRFLSEQSPASVSVHSETGCIRKLKSLCKH
ncbi:hypothetical protein HH212_16995 [Massilia forsythiae]|uniref:REase associating with pPIWI RE domain-containing protein n=1 Tax=Massilia forsythiae TaxID=2728020 RepID=A0A7Z2ZTE6_9BURK|nr:hypothetical protein [Massilia forsythiae]QJE01513.1 hypothetical protein HH212_16995 [Massilia forsythiae]